MNDYMRSVLPNIEKYTKIYSSSIDGFNGDTFRDKCKNHQHTIAIAKSNHNKILGGYSPMKWQNYTNWTVVTGGKSFVYFYDDDKLRICT